ncbi:AAA family ATPase [Streptomyces sp. NPDC008317]|uniref:AAA family ATPase n=1 Tax=Streptomyces sp. NPDC008317 TaxID=3364827 RepID=UPI0036E0B69E
MKPLTLDLTGFRSYPTRTTIDFTGRSLVAALGDTGAGKSSLLDAITFALFRKSSWDAREPRQLIADGAQAMSVELTFLHGGQRWQVHRTMHASNPNAGRHHLANLDTGEQVDSATAVDARVKAVLQMGYDTFLRVGLLPQGRFDQLLTAPPKERSERLRELFGAESLESVQQLAARHAQTLNGLLIQARAKRDPMPQDPAQAAAEAAEAADAAAARAEYLNAAVEHITGLQEEVTAARETAAQANTVAQDLSEHTVANADAVLDSLEPLAADIAKRCDATQRSIDQADTDERALAEEINAADAAGESRDALAKAATTLSTLAADAHGHRSERDRLTALTDQLANEDAALTAAEADLTARTAHSEPLAAQARAAAQSSREIRDHAAAARTLLTAALTAAQHTADTAAAHAAAQHKAHNARADEGRREEDEQRANADHDAARTQLETLQRHDQAAAVAADLHPGSDCPVCHQELPPDFEPAAADVTALTAARTRLKEAETARDTARRRLAQANGALQVAEQAVLDRAEEHQDAQHKEHSAAITAAHSFQDLATRTNDAFDAAAATATLTALTTAIRSATPHSDQTTAPITGAITVCEQAAEAKAENLHTEQLRQAAALEADRKTLDGNRTSHQRSTTELKTALERHTRALARTVADARALPARFRATLPDETITVTADQAAAAAAAVDARRTELQELTDRREAAREEKIGLLADQRALENEHRTTVERPLNDLRGHLDAWAGAAGRAIAHLDASAHHQVPKTPTGAGITEIRQYTADLGTTASALAGTLTERTNKARTRAEAAATDLRRHAATLTDVDRFDPAADLTNSQAVHPLVAAAARAAQEEQDQRDKQLQAQDLIQPAADLDYAIAAATARHEALEVLRRELVDAKFLGHLTMLRTQALLGVASDMLGQMSDGQFGFAESFDIVSRSSGVVHHPNRLSGGEKFLASLALALALAELHSRSGPALGSLFLDEGFAALDTTALDAALDVLRTQAGGDRLVVVISHLHAVAEAVDDVLWVERTSSGSSARWLTAAERDDLVQADLASGLQTLAP